MARPKAVNSIEAMQELIDQNSAGFQEMPGELVDPGQMGDEISDDLALQATLTQLGEQGTEAKVIVYRIDGDKKKDVYLYDCTVSEFADGGLNEIQNYYGGGEYRIRVYAGNRVLTHRKLTIGESRTPRKLPGAEPVTPDIGALMAANNAAMMAGFKELAASMRPAQTNSSMEIIQLITALQPLMARPQAVPQATPQADPFEMIGKLLDIQNKLAPRDPSAESSGTDLLMKTIDVFGKPIAEAMSKAQAPAQAMIPAHMEPPIPEQPQALPAPAIQAETMENPVMNELQLKIALLKPTLLLMAQHQADPYPYACMALDMLDDAQIKQYIEPADWWNQLQTLIPEAAPFESWFADLRAQILTLLQEDENTSTVAGSDHSPTA